MTLGGMNYQDPVSSIRKVTVTHSGIARKPLSTAEAYILHVSAPQPAVKASLFPPRLPFSALLLDTTELMF